MKKIRSFTLVKVFLKLFGLVAFFSLFLFLIYLWVNREPVSAWDKIKKVSEPRVNLFKFFSWKLWILIFFFTIILGIFYEFPIFRMLEGWFERKKLFDFAQGVHMAMVSADVGKGKTLLLSILAKHLPHGIKKVGFVSNVPDAKLLSYNDLNFDEPIPEIETYSIPKYYFVDEVNFLIEGTSFIENRIYHKGVAWLLQICRHHKMRVWISATRDHHVWASVRHMANYYVKLGGPKHLMSVGRFHFYNQRIRFYSQSEELEAEFNITVSNLDFALYDSYWLKGTRFFRPTYEDLERKGKEERERKRKEREKEKEETERFEKQRQKIVKQFRWKVKELVGVLEKVSEKKKEARQKVGRRLVEILKEVRRKKRWEKILAEDKTEVKKVLLEEPVSYQPNPRPKRRKSSRELFEEFLKKYLKKD